MFRTILGVTFGSYVGLPVMAGMFVTDGLGDKWSWLVELS